MEKEREVLSETAEQNEEAVIERGITIVGKIFALHERQPQFYNRLVEFADSLKRDYTFDVVRDYKLWHVLGGSTNFPGDCHRLDFPNGEVMEFLEGIERKMEAAKEEK